jgi:hypothetical protein
VLKVDALFMGEKTTKPLERRQMGAILVRRKHRMIFISIALLISMAGIQNVPMI